MKLSNLLSLAEKFEKLLSSNKKFSVVGCARGKVYNYEGAKPIFQEGETFLSGDSLPLKEITLKSDADPKDQGKLYLKE